MTPDTAPWPGHPDWTTITIDYPVTAPGVLEIDHIRATVYGHPLPIPRRPSTVFPGGWSITYPCQDALLAHVAAMRIYQAKLDAVSRADEPTDEVRHPQPPAPPPVERPVFGMRLNPRDGQRLARQAGQGALL